MRSHRRANGTPTVLYPASARLSRSAGSKPTEHRHSFRAISGNGKPRDLAALNWRTNICNEINSRRRALLTNELGFQTHEVDAEIIDDLLPAKIQPTAVLMNPPFSATGGRVAKHSAQYGARHIESALRRLQQGGRLVAITGEGMRFQVSAFSEWWQRIAKTTYNVRANVHLNGNEYGKYATTFDLQILVI